MGIRESFEKLSKLVKGEGPPKKGLSPAEVELMSYKERERQDRIKKELEKYRLQNNREFILGNKIGGKSSILSAKNTINKKFKTPKSPNILGAKNSILR